MTPSTETPHLTFLRIVPVMLISISPVNLWTSIREGRNDYDQQTCREHHIRYYQTITGLDREVGRLLEILEKENLTDNTVIIFASDHGLLMGEYGMGGKALLYDLSQVFFIFYQ